MAELSITVAVTTGTQYVIGGSGNVFTFDGSQPASFTFPWVASGTLRLDQSGSSNDGHPLIFSTSNSSVLSTMKAGIISSGVTYYLDGSSNQSDYTNTTTFNAATTRYIEIAPASETDFYFACWVHGIGMGGIMDMTQDTWGALPWSQGNWGDQDNNLVIPTGLSMTATLGEALSYPEEGWGSDAWGIENWGQTGLSVPLTGISMTASLGTLAYAAALDGWGRGTWSEDDWGDDTLTIPISGLSMTGYLGTPGAASEQGWGREEWGNEPWGDSNSPVVGITGLSMTGSLGTLAYAAAEDGWSRGSWGEDDWGDDTLTIPITGLSMTGYLGSVGAAAEQGWGRAEWGNEPWGDSNSPVVTVTGLSMTGALGTLAYAASEAGWGRDEWGYGNWGENISTVILDGLEMTTGLGEEGWGRSTWGNDAWGQGNIVDIELGTPVTGLQMTGSLGTSQANYDFKFDLDESLLMTASRGVLSINNNADHTQGVGGSYSLITGTLNAAGVDVADVVFGPTSFLATMALGAAAAGDVQRISVTGFGITASQGSIGSIPDMAIGSGSFAITGSLGTFTITDMQIGVSGFEITANLGSGGVAPLHYKDVDITGYTAYTDIEHSA